MVVFRMHSPAYDVFDTMGSFMKGGRWHSAGVRVLYTAQHASLAVLEQLIHAGGRKLPPRVITSIRIPGHIAVESAPWIDFPDSRAYGNLWVLEARSVALRVPSIAVNKMEHNMILNPAHPDFRHIRHDPAQEFVFSPGYFLPA